MTQFQQWPYMDRLLSLAFWLCHFSQSPIATVISEARKEKTHHSRVQISKKGKTKPLNMRTIYARAR
eukprot:2616955-Amphidinium_carterae.2